MHCLVLRHFLLMCNKPSSVIVFDMTNNGASLVVLYCLIFYIPLVAVKTVVLNMQESGFASLLVLLNLFVQLHPPGLPHVLMCMCRHCLC